MSNIIKTIPLEEIISFYLEINESKKYNGNFFKNYIKKYYPKQNKKSRENSLPAWIYIFTLAVLITIIIAFYSCLIK